MENKIMRLLAEYKQYGIKHTVKYICNYNCRFFSRFLQVIFLYFTKSKPLKNIIIIESHNDFDCNGGAFYSYLIRNDYNKKYLIVWLLGDKKNANRKTLPANVKAYTLSSLSILKNYYIVRAKLFTADGRVTNKVRDDQVSFFFDHGSFSLKSVKKYMVLPETIDYYLTASANFDPIFCETRNISYSSSKLLHLGYPMHDVFYQDTPSELPKIQKKKYDKVILWMPTFRKGLEGRNDSNAEYTYGIPLIDSQDEFDTLQRTLEELDILLIIKIHPMQDKESTKLLMKCTSDNISVLTGDTVKQLDIDNYRLLKDADALISDYSSIVYSYILLDRPIGFVLSDLNDMKYGICVDNPDFFITGQRIYTLDDMISFIQNVSENKDEFRKERRNLCNWLHEYQDGNSCERIVKFLSL